MDALRLFRWLDVILRRDSLPKVFSLKKIPKWRQFIWSHRLLMLDHTTVISFFVGIKAFLLTWCNLGGEIFFRRLFHWKYFQNWDVYWGAFIWSCHLLIFYNTKAISFFVGIMAWKPTWNKFWAGFFAESFFIEKNFKMGTPFGAHSFDLAIFKCFTTRQ